MGTAVIEPLAKQLLHLFPQVVAPEIESCHIRDELFLIVALPDRFAKLIAPQIDSLGGGGLKTGNKRR